MTRSDPEFAEFDRLKAEDCLVAMHRDPVTGLPVLRGGPPITREQVAAILAEEDYE